MVQACHPECRYLCDDPVCYPTCVAKVEPPRCTVNCNSCFIPEPGQCNFHCNSVSLSNGDFCEADSCPIAETLCSELVCSNLPNGVTCSVLCEAPVSGWHCVEPTHCKKPICKLQCEKPACEFAGQSKILWSLILFIFLVFFNRL